MLRALRRRIAMLEKLLGRKRGIPIILVQTGETHEEAKERHLREKPLDKDAKAFISIKTVDGGPTAGPPPRPGSEKTDSRAQMNFSNYDSDEPLAITR